MDFPLLAKKTAYGVWSVGTLQCLPRDLVVSIFCFVEFNRSSLQQLKLVCKSFAMILDHPRVIAAWKNRRYGTRSLVKPLNQDAVDSYRNQFNHNDLTREKRYELVRELCVRACCPTKEDFSIATLLPEFHVYNDDTQLQKLCFYVLGNYFPGDHEMVLLTCGTFMKGLYSADPRTVQLCITAICKLMPDALLPCFNGFAPKLLLHNDAGVRWRAVELLRRHCETEGIVAAICDPCIHIEKLFNDPDVRVSIAALALVEQFDLQELGERLVRAFIVRNLEAGSRLCEAIRILAKVAKYANHDDLFSHLLQHSAPCVVYETVMAIARKPFPSLFGKALDATSKFGVGSVIRRKLLEMLAPLDWHAEIALSLFQQREFK